MPENETRPRPNFDYEEKGGYTGGPRPEGKPPIPTLFKPDNPASPPTPADTPAQPPPSQASNE